MVLRKATGKSFLENQEGCRCKNLIRLTSGHSALLHKELTDLDVLDKVSDLRSFHDPLRTPTATLYINTIDPSTHVLVSRVTIPTRIGPFGLILQK